MVHDNRELLTTMWFADLAAQVETGMEQAASTVNARPSDLSNLIRLAHAALLIAKIKDTNPAGMVGQPADWHRAQAMTLLESAMDAVSMLAASGGPDVKDMH